MPAGSSCATGLLLGLLLVALAAPAWGWGSPHAAITQAALSTLPDWQRVLLGEEYEALGSRYCFIPDWIFSHPETRSFAMMETKPDIVYLLLLHLPEDPAENYDCLRYFLGHAVAALRAGNVGDAARYAGTLAHALEDWGCPAHAVPGDNMFTLLKQLLPPPEPFEHKLLHSPIEEAVLQVDLGERPPRCLGESVDEAAWRLLHEADLAVLNARAQVVPIIQGLYADDREAITAAQTICAARDAEVVADAVYTLLCLGGGRPDTAAAADLQTADLAACNPLEAPHLFLPQSTFFSQPYWGYPRAGTILAEGKTPTPLRLRVEEDGQVVERTYSRGIGTGTRSVLTYLVPQNVFRQFTVAAGLHAALGGAGQVKLEVLGDGQPLATASLAGGQPAQRLACDLRGVTRLQLVASGAGGDGKANYVVWGEPTLRK